jgi:zinc protease
MLIRSSRFFALPLLALACAAAPATAQEKPAPVSVLTKAVDIPYESFTLSNGLRVIVHTDRKAPVVAVAVWYHIGSKNEPKGKTGFAHLFEHLMFNGSENLPGDFFVPLREVGATDFNGTTDFDRTNYFQTVPTGALDFVLFAEADRMGNLLGGVTQAKLDNQRSVVQNEKRQGDNQPFGLVFYRILEELYPEGHPYHHPTIGSMADLDAATLPDVKGWFSDNYGPNNAVLVLAGDIDAKTARPLVEKRFGSFKRGPVVKRPIVSVPTLSAPKTVRMTDKVATTRIMKTWTIPGGKEKDVAALQVGASVLGGLSSSRLDNILVRQEQLAVRVSAGAWNLENAGIFIVSVDVKPGVDPKVVEARLDAIMADFFAKGPSADEVQRVSTVAVSGVIDGLESVGGFGGKAVTLAEGATFSNNPGQYKVDLAAIAKVKPAAVVRASQTWLAKRPALTLIITPGDREAYVEANTPTTTAAPAAEAEPEAKIDRSKLPAVGALKGLDFPTIERTTLSNGVEVYFTRVAAVPKVQVSISFDAGYAADPATALGTQSLMLNVMQEGTTTRSSTQIAEESERLGANLYYGASMDRTTIGISALTPNLGASLSLLADIIINPAFAPGEVDRVRDQQLTTIAGELNQPQGLAMRVLPATLYGANYPYGRPPSGTGRTEIVKALTPQALGAFHKRWIRPDTARIFVVGSTSLAEVKPMLERSFGTWKTDGSQKGIKDFSAAIPAAKPRIILIDRPNSPQSYILAGEVLGLSGRDDQMTLRAANENLGGDFLSRINMDLRESKGWSYGVRTGVSGNENAISFTISAPVQADKTGESIKVILAQLDGFLGPNGLTPTELDQTIKGNVRGLPGRFETSGAVMGGLTDIVNFGRADEYYEQLGPKYLALTAASIDATARRYIDPKKLVFVIVGDAAKVKPQLDGLGIPVEVIPATQAQ